MIISTFSVCLHLAAGEVSSGDEVTADILQMASEPLPACRVVGRGPPSLRSDLKNKKKKEINPPETTSRWLYQIAEWIEMLKVQLTI